MEPNNPYAPPATDPGVPPPAAETIPLASLSQRLGGAIVDGLINLAVVVVVYAAGWFAFALNPFDENPAFLVTLILSILVFVAFIGINWKFLTTSGQTIGKKAAKTRIVTMEGHLPTVNDLVFKRYAFMNLIGLIPFVGFVISIINILFIFRSDRRCIHDLLAGTQVVKADFEAEKAAPEMS